MDGGKQYATVKDWDKKYFREHSTFQFLTPDMINQWKEKNPNKLMEVEYTGFGWMLVKKGVFERLKYPWFSPIFEKDIAPNVIDFCSEDVSFCQKVLQKGFKIYIDPDIIVGHEKTFVY